jgi:hypothetical protein
MHASRFAGVVILVLGLHGAPPVAEPQSAPKVARVGFLVGSAPGSPEAQAALDALRQGLRERGWVEGQNIIVETLTYTSARRRYRAWRAPERPPRPPKGSSQ